MSVISFIQTKQKGPPIPVSIDMLIKDDHGDPNSSSVCNVEQKKQVDIFSQRADGRLKAITFVLNDTDSS